MSLKVVHLFFVVTLSALCFGCGIWKISSYFPARAQHGDLVFGLGALLLGVLVVVYGRHFWKKFKRLGYL